MTVGVYAVFTLSLAVGLCTLIRRLDGRNSSHHTAVTTNEYGGGGGADAVVIHRMV